MGDLAAIRSGLFSKTQGSHTTQTIIQLIILCPLCTLGTILHEQTALQEIASARISATMRSSGNNVQLEQLELELSQTSRERNFGCLVVVHYELGTQGPRSIINVTFSATD